MHLLGRSVRARSVRLAALAVPATVAVLLFTGTNAYANVAVTQVSSDPYADAQAQHRTEVESAARSPIRCRLAGVVGRLVSAPGGIDVVQRLCDLCDCFAGGLFVDLVERGAEAGTHIR